MLPPDSGNKSTRLGAQFQAVNLPVPKAPLLAKAPQQASNEPDHLTGKDTPLTGEDNKTYEEEVVEDKVPYKRPRLN